MWAGLLLRFWKPLAGLVLILGAGLYLSHVRYESGYAASEAKWRPLFAAAERARDAANEKARRKELDSTALSVQTEKQHAETLVSLQSRAADADKRLRALSVRLAAARSCRVDVPEASRSSSQPDGATESEQRASEAGGRIAGTGGDCEFDAATIILWQRFYSGVRSTINRAD